MARKPRGVEPGVAYHITQRSNDRRDVFLRPDDFLTYLDLLRRTAADCDEEHTPRANSFYTPPALNQPGSRNVLHS